MVSRWVPMLLAVAALGWLPAAARAASSKQADDYTGSYRVLIRGFWMGEGTATVGPGGISIVARVQDESGRAGTLTTGSLRINNHRVTGSGTVMGAGMTVWGRVDAADGPVGPVGPVNGEPQGPKHGKPVLMVARLELTFAAGGHAGRIAGGRNPPPAPK